MIDDDVIYALVGEVAADMVAMGLDRVVVGRLSHKIEATARQLLSAPAVSKPADLTTIITQAVAKAMDQRLEVMFGGQAPARAKVRVLVRLPDNKRTTVTVNPALMEELTQQHGGDIHRAKEIVRQAYLQIQADTPAGERSSQVEARLQRLIEAARKLKQSPAASGTKH